MSLGFFRFLHRAAPALGLGFVLAFGSSIGQTYFISLFAGELRAELNLSHGAFGGLYTLATVASAATLVWLGKLADRFSLVALSLVTLGALVAFALVMAQVETLLGLGLALYGLRLGGQGMMSHLAITAMGRWFVRERGRALSVATLGFPAGEALLPGLVAVLLGTMAWRSVWVTMAIVLGGVLLPTVWWLGRVVHRRHLDRPQRLSTAADAPEVTPWTRRQVLRDGRFYALLPGLLAPPFIITGVLFHQVHLVTLKGWSLAGFAACYPLYAGCATAVALGLGGLVDRLGAIRLLPFYLLPLAMGLTLGAVSAAPFTAAVFMALLGCTAGGATLVLGALWAELYGTTHLGSIRALAVALMVLATALAPGGMGWLIDRGVGLEVQFALLAVYTVGCALAFGRLLPQLQSHRSPPAVATR